MERHSNHINGSFMQDDSSDLFDIKKVVGNLLNHWYYFVIGLFITLSLVLFYIWYADPVYQINAEIMVENQTNGNSSSSLTQSASMFQDLGGAFNMSSTVDNEEEILLTRSLMNRVVRDLQLNVTYYKQDNIRKVENFEGTPFTVHLISVNDSIMPFQLQWKEVSPTSYQLWNADDVKITTAVYGSQVRYNNCVFFINRNHSIPVSKGSSEKYFCQITSYDGATTAFQYSLSVTVPNDKANAIDLTMNSKVPSKGEFVLNYFIQRYLRSSLEQRNQIADSTLGFINERLGIVTAELGEVEKQVALYKGNNKIISPEVQSQLMATTYDANFKLASQFDLQLQVIDNLKSYLQDDKNNKRIVPSNLVTADPIFTELVGKYNTLMIERDRVSLNYPETNPLLQNINVQLANLRQDMVNNLSSSQSSLQQSKAQLQKNDRSLNSQIFGAPAVENGFLELAREQKIKEALYLFLVQRREEIAISRASNMAKAKVIDDPKAVADPVSPNDTILLIGAVIIGLFFPAIIVYGQSVLNTKILSRDDLIKKTQVPILAELGHGTTSQTLVTTSPRSLLTEQFRTLRTNLQFVLSNKEYKSVMITSSMGGEGKSFIALNLATILALTDKKVLVVDLDLRKPKVFKYLNLPDADGISNFLISDMQAEDIIHSSGVHPNFYVVHAGTIPPNPTELLLSSRLTDFFNFANQHFDYVIIDSAPVGVISDAQIVSKYASITLYVVRQRLTLKNQLNIIQDMHENEKIKNLFIVFNDVKMQSKYGYGYSHGYGYSYGSNGYFEGHGKSKKFKLKKVFSKFSES